MELRFDDQRITTDDAGVWLCLRVLDATAARGFVLQAKGAYIAALKRFREKRSMDANRYYWLLCDKLAEATGLRKSDIYRSHIRDIGGVSDTVCVQDKAVNRLCTDWESRGLGWQTAAEPSKLPGCTNVTLYFGSSTYDTAQMSRLIDLMVQDCRQQDIETMTPLELERLKEEWNAQ